MAGAEDAEDAAQPLPLLVIFDATPHVHRGQADNRFLSTHAHDVGDSSDTRGKWFDDMSPDIIRICSDLHRCGYTTVVGVPVMETVVNFGHDDGHGGVTFTPSKRRVLTRGWPSGHEVAKHDCVSYAGFVLVPLTASEVHAVFDGMVTDEATAALEAAGNEDATSMDPRSALWRLAAQRELCHVRDEMSSGADAIAPELLLEALVNKAPLSIGVCVRPPLCSHFIARYGLGEGEADVEAESEGEGEGEAAAGEDEGEGVAAAGEGEGEGAGEGVAAAGEGDAEGVAAAAQL